MMVQHPQNFRPEHPAHAYPGRLYAAARPGWERPGVVGRVAPHLVEAWVKGIHQRLIGGGVARSSPVQVRYVCLLGSKQIKGHRVDELRAYYGVRRPEEAEVSDLSTLQELLNSVEPGLIRFSVVHVPMMDDHEEAQPEDLDKATGAILDGLRAGELVLVGCSAGCDRTGKVLSALRARVGATGTLPGR